MIGALSDSRIGGRKIKKLQHLGAERREKESDQQIRAARDERGRTHFERTKEPLSVHSCVIIRGHELVVPSTGPVDATALEQAEPRRVIRFEPASQITPDIRRRCTPVECLPKYRSHIGCSSLPAILPHDCTIAVQRSLDRAGPTLGSSAIGKLMPDASKLASCRAFFRRFP